MSKLKLIIKRYMPTKYWGILVKAKSFVYHNSINLCEYLYDSYLIQKSPKRHQKALEINFY